MTSAATAPSLKPTHEEARPSRGSDFANQYLTFRLCDHSYAVPLAHVAEITTTRHELNHMPHMPKGVEGLLDMRGSVLPVINLRVRLGLPNQDYRLSQNILILDLGGGHIGVLVDYVESVITASAEQFKGASPLLAGPEGGWVRGFLLTQNRIISVLDSHLITTQGSARFHTASSVYEDLGQKLDENLVRLIELAPKKSDAEEARIVPQIEAAIAHTENEMAKVVDRVEAMLGDADQAFRGLAHLKQEVQLGHFAGEEAAVAEIEKVGQQIQDSVFELLQQLQFQDIARQKLERVLNHIRGMQSVIGTRFKEPTQES